MRLNRLLTGMAALSAVSLALSACGGTSGGGSGNSTPDKASASPGAGAGAALVHTASIKVGSTTETVLKDDRGLTLYYFTPDTATSVACTGGCAAVWPPLTSPGGAAPVSDPALPGSLTLMAGSNQVLYNGHPLYTYSKDGDPGDAYGQGIGGKWFVATPQLAAAGSTPKPSSTYTPVY